MLSDKRGTILCEGGVPIVLTASIAPEAAFTLHTNPEVRRREYLAAIDFYRQFAPVYFLENSTYDIAADAAFHSIPGVTVLKILVEDKDRKGKGYQEFCMLDRWILAEARPPRRWIKITGRYLFSNFAGIFLDSRNQKDGAASLIIDQHALSRKAHAHIFCVDTDFYLKHLQGVYEECDDSKGNWIEYVLYRRLEGFPSPQVRCHKFEPRLNRIMSSRGEFMKTSLVKWKIKALLRALNCTFDKRYLWYGR